MAGAKKTDSWAAAHPKGVPNTTPCASSGTLSQEPGFVLVRFGDPYKDEYVRWHWEKLNEVVVNWNCPDHVPIYKKVT